MNKLDCTTKISKKNLNRISKLKISGYEPNDYVINLALEVLEKNKDRLLKGGFSREKLAYSTKISRSTIKRISSLKVSGYEPNDFVIGIALDLLEEKSG